MVTDANNQIYDGHVELRLNDFYEDFPGNSRKITAVSSTGQSVRVLLVTAPPHSPHIFPFGWMVHSSCVALLELQCGRAIAGIELFGLLRALQPDSINFSVLRFDEAGKFLKAPTWYIWALVP